MINNYSDWHSGPIKLSYDPDCVSPVAIKSLKTLIVLIGVKVEETELSSDNSLFMPDSLLFLESPDGTIFSLNTIMRYLAETHKK